MIQKFNTLVVIHEFETSKWSNKVLIAQNQYK